MDRIECLESFVAALTSSTFSFLEESMSTERFRIRHPRMTCCDNHHATDNPGHEAAYDEADFERWRIEIFAAAEVGRIVDFLTPLLRPAHPHVLDRWGLRSACRCGWEDEGRYFSDTRAKQAWWEHARDLIDFEAVEAEWVMKAISSI